MGEKRCFDLTYVGLEDGRHQRMSKPNVTIQELALAQNPRNHVNCAELTLKREETNGPTILALGQSQLYAASRCGDVRLVEKLLQSRMDPTSVQDGSHREDGSSALHVAAHRGHADVLDVLMRHA